MPDPVVFNHGYYSTNDYVPQHVTVDVSGLELGKAGANLSSRMVLTVEDEAGGKVKGFFTANEYIDWGTAFSNRFKSEAEKPGNEKFRPVYDKLRERFQNGDLHWDEMFKGLGVKINPKEINNLKIIIQHYGRSIQVHYRPWRRSDDARHLYHPRCMHRHQIQ